VKLERTAEGRWQARTKTFLAPLGRPMDVHVAGGKIYVLEYTRPTRFKEQVGWLPGRIIEVAPVGATAKAQ
jgi:hypothetical protein